MITVISALIPWVAYAIAGAKLSITQSLAIASLVTLLPISIAFWSGKKPNELVIEFSTAVGFAIACLASLVMEPETVRSFLPAFSQLWLAAIVCLGVLAKRPFTLAIAKRQAPSQIWSNAAFLKFNYRITIAWAISFTIAGILLLILRFMPVGSTDSTFINIIIITAGVVIPMRYQKFAQDQLLRAMRDQA